MIARPDADSHERPHNNLLRRLNSADFALMDARVIELDALPEAESQSTGGAANDDHG